MHPFEIEQALDGMVCLLDTREQATTRLRARLKQINLPYERVALPFGDYSCKCPLPGGNWLDLKNTVCIERKESANELCNCFTHDRARFEREFERAKAANARLYLLVENTTLEMLYGGHYRSKVLPKAVIASLFAWIARYDCRLIMCREQTGGLVIREILRREAKERLTSYDG